MVRLPYPSANTDRVEPKVLSLTDGERKAVALAPSKFANDAEFVSAFIAEVGRNAETGVAVKTGGPKPRGHFREHAKGAWSLDGFDRHSHGEGCDAVRPSAPLD